MSLKLNAGLLVLHFLVSISPGWAEVNEIDSDFDGTVDQWQHVSVNGNVEKIEHDSNADGKVDQVDYYGENKKVLRVEFDRNSDGKMDHHQIYSEAGKADSSGKVEQVQRFDRLEGVLWRK